MYGNPGNSHPMVAGRGRDLFAGGEGVDTVLFSGMRNDFLITGTMQGRSVANATGYATDMMLLNVERIHFSDMKLAFDDAAMNTARIIGAAFGPESMRPDLNGVGISFFDQGMTMAQVASIALAAMGEHMTDESFVNTLYTNAVGHVPDRESLMYFTDMLDRGMSRTDLFMLAANSDANAQCIGLVGIVDQGLGYF